MERQTRCSVGRLPTMLSTKLGRFTRSYSTVCHLRRFGKLTTCCSVFYCNFFLAPEGEQSRTVDATSMTSAAKTLSEASYEIFSSLHCKLPVLHRTLRLGKKLVATPALRLLYLNEGWQKHKVEHSVGLIVLATEMS